MRSGRWPRIAPPSLSVTQTTVSRTAHEVAVRVEGPAAMTYRSWLTPRGARGYAPIFAPILRRTLQTRIFAAYSTRSRRAARFFLAVAPANMKTI